MLKLPVHVQNAIPIHCECAPAAEPRLRQKISIDVTNPWGESIKRAPPVVKMMGPPRKWPRGGCDGPPFPLWDWGKDWRKTANAEKIPRHHQLITFKVLPNA